MEQHSGQRVAADGRHGGCTWHRMVYTALGVVVLAVVAAVVIQRSRARHAARKETERDIARAEGEGMVAHRVHD